MVLLHQVVHVLAEAPLARFSRQILLFQLLDGSDGEWVLVDVDDPGCDGIRSAQCFAEKSLSGSRTARLTQENPVDLFPINFAPSKFTDTPTGGLLFGNKPSV